LMATLFIVIGVALGMYLPQQPSNQSASSSKFDQKLSDIMEAIDRNYVDSVDKDQLFQKTITQLLHDLDPHSNYISAEQFTAANEQIEGSFGGVGIRFTIYDDTLSVVNVIPQSPAFRAGIKKFDQFIEVDGEDIADGTLTNKHVRELLKGKADTPVKINLLRKGKSLKKEIIRDVVPIKSITAAYMITDDVGYMRLTTFSKLSAQEFYKAALRLQTHGMKNLIFDLRSNGGGVLGAAVAIIDAILEKDKIIVSTKGVNSPERIITSENDPFLGDVELAVLINSGSASASEIVSGALQDNDRGTVIGRRSFGKGLVQQDIELKDSSRLRLTVSRYYTPTGRSIQKPYNGNYQDYIMDEMDRYENGELYALDSSLFVDSLKYTTPKGKVVYGGGGIMPDIFIPLDTAGSSIYFRKLLYANVFNEFSYHYARFNDLAAYKNISDFDTRFHVNKAVIKEFKAYVEKHSDVEFNPTGYRHAIERIKEGIKGEIARQRWLEEGAQYIYNQHTEEVQKAIEVLEGD